MQNMVLSATALLHLRGGWQRVTWSDQGSMHAASLASFGPTYCESIEAPEAGRIDMGPATVIWIEQCSTNEII